MDRDVLDCSSLDTITTANSTVSEQEWVCTQVSLMDGTPTWKFAKLSKGAEADNPEAAPRFKNRFTTAGMAPMVEMSASDTTQGEPASCGEILNKTDYEGDAENEEGKMKEEVTGLEKRTEDEAGEKEGKTEEGKAEEEGKLKKAEEEGKQKVEPEGKKADEGKQKDEEDKTKEGKRKKGRKPEDGKQKDPRIPQATMTESRYGRTIIDTIRKLFPCTRIPDDLS